MKKILLSVSIVFMAAVVAVCSPVRSMLGAAGGEIADCGMPTAADYIQDGLVLHFDAIENVGYGAHLSIASGWFDHVSGTTYEFSNGEMVFSDTALIKTDSANTTLLTGSQIGDICRSDLKTYEIGYGIYPDDISSWPSSMNVFAFDGNAYQSIQFRKPNEIVSYFDGQYIFNQRNHKIGAITFIRDGDFCYSFFNSVRYWKRSVSNPIYTSLGNIRLNGCPDGRIEIKFIRVYSRALTPEEIAYNHFIDEERFSE